MVIHADLKVDGRSIGRLCKLGRVQTFSKSTELLYQGHIPMVAFLILEGEIKLFKNKKLKAQVSSGVVIGVKELLSDKASKVSALATENTTVCFLDRSTILSIIQEYNTKLSSFFQKLRDN